jgi:2-polyprenyl-6-hydroxyphenyl methylase/3-demethylubiquinone-9 3-methyltransferase
MKPNKLIDYSWCDDYYETPLISKDLIKIIKNIEFTNKKSYLDVGCGNGSITKKLSHFFKSTTGIDLSSQGIEQAKKVNNTNIEFLNLGLELLIKKRKFDFVSAIEVIEHQYDPYLFIKQLAQVTSDNGYVLISTPYHGYFKNLFIALFGKMDRHFTALWRHGHIKFFSKKTLTELILAKNTNFGKKNLDYKFQIQNIFYSGRFFPLSRSMIFLIRKKSN